MQNLQKIKKWLLNRTESEATTDSQILRARTPIAFLHHFAEQFIHEQIFRLGFYLIIRNVSFMVIIFIHFFSLALLFFVLTAYFVAGLICIISSLFQATLNCFSFVGYN